MDSNNVIIAPIISEKSMKDVNAHKFTFRVAGKANKRLIKKAIEEKFDVNVLHVSTNIVKGKKTRVGLRRTEIEKSPWKKAIVTIPQKQKIALFDVSAKS